MFNGYSWQTRTLEVRADRIPPEFDFSNPVPPPFHHMPYSASLTIPGPYITQSNNPFLYHHSTSSDAGFGDTRASSAMGSLASSSSLASLSASSPLAPSSPTYSNPSTGSQYIAPVPLRATSGLQMPKALTPSMMGPNASGRSLFVGNVSSAYNFTGHN